MFMSPDKMLLKNLHLNTQYCLLHKQQQQKKHWFLNRVFLNNFQTKDPQTDCIKLILHSNTLSALDILSICLAKFTDLWMKFFHNGEKNKNNYIQRLTLEYFIKKILKNVLKIKKDQIPSCKYTCWQCTMFSKVAVNIFTLESHEPTASTVQVHLETQRLGSDPGEFCMPYSHQTRAEVWAQVDRGVAAFWIHLKLPDRFLHLKKQVTFFSLIQTWSNSRSVLSGLLFYGGVWRKSSRDLDHFWIT